MADGRLQLNNRRVGPGTRKYQKSSDLLLRKAPISRLISMSDFEVLQKKLRRALKVNSNNKVQNLSCPAGAAPSTPGTDSLPAPEDAAPLLTPARPQPWTLLPVAESTFK
ncbi:histone H3-like centromeric protein A [Dissostichus eleginoides]|uniref:Histone H3-like centromeric protein A n=1 Tax=Dissostichus eleginoides TaxID=100907 RepID=A0AAD9B5H0_DISEL|nr:histone H3-like centromeric protein A [Dissostichus eleginoides]